MIEPSDASNATVSSTQGADSATAPVLEPQLQQQASLLDFDALDSQGRSVLLRELAQEHRLEPFSELEARQVKELRLFSSRTAPDTAISIAECGAGGVYWCTDDSVLETVKQTIGLTRGRGSGGAAAGALLAERTGTRMAAGSGSGSSGGTGVADSTQASPVVLQYDPALQELYTLLGVEELTAATAVRKFTVPALAGMDAHSRVEIMLRLAARWDSYRSDEALVQRLKELAFIPPWEVPSTDTSTSGTSTATVAGGGGRGAVGSALLMQDDDMRSCVGVDVDRLRKASELFLWTSDDLLSALQGSALPLYVSPRYLRTPEMHVMCRDLGMSAELTEASLRRVVGDIESTVDLAAECGDDALKAEAAERGRRILHYLLQDDRISTLLQNSHFARSIGSVRFVPMRLPVAVQAGGFIEFTDQVGSFNQFVAKRQSPLCFTVKPILDDDITPSHFYFSFLGITSAPSIEAVLRHVRNLTSHGESLDRWNAPPHCSIAHTFSAVFQFLFDNWRQVSPNVKTALRDTPLVPVGHLLIKPSRLFFRLAEDLAPFMHELPRHFGAHEEFLKELGVQELPAVRDYLRFLQDLSAECGAAASLNPNELRAVVAILQAVATQRSEAMALAGAETAAGSPSAAEVVTLLEQHLWLPDEQSRMRPVGSCLVSDDPWLAGKVSAQLARMGLHLAHPFLSPRCAAQLGLPRLSSAVVQELCFVGNAEADSEGKGVGQWEAERQRLEQVLRDPVFVDALAMLLAGQQHQNQDKSPALEEGVLSVRDLDGVGGQQDLRSGGREALCAALAGLRLKPVYGLRTRFRLRHDDAADDAGAGYTGGSDQATDIGEQATLSFLRRAAHSMEEGNADAGGAGGGGGAGGAGAAVGTQLLINVDPMVLTGAAITVDLAAACGVCQCVGADLHLSTAVAALLQASSRAIGAEAGAGMGATEAAGSAGAVLDALRVGDSAAAAREQRRGVPGEVLSALDRGLLELRPFRQFRVGEVVAVEEAAAAGSTSGAAPPHASAAGGEAAANVGTGVLRYARVLTVSDADQLGLRRLTLRGGGGGGGRAALAAAGRTLSLLSTEVYSFQSAREQRRQQVSGTQTELLSSPAGLKVVSGSGMRSTAAGDGAPASGTGIKAAPVQSEEAVSAGTASGAIAQTELVGALRGLLSRAGVPLDLERQALVERIVELEAVGQRAERELGAQRTQLAQSMQALDAASSALQCPICISRDVSHVLLPCGHTLCEECCAAMRGARCPHCRRGIQAKVRFYLPTPSDSNS